MKRLARLGWIVLGVVFLQLVWTGFQRDRSSRRTVIQRQVQPSFLVDEGPGVKILQFYAASGEVVRGEQAIVCYGVRNAKTVRLDPIATSVRPVRNRCINVSPTRTTTYRLVAEGFDGQTETASFTLHVTPPPPRILFIEVSSFDLKLGEPWALCYGLEHTLAARLDPLKINLPVGRKRCLQMYLVRTMKYTFVATGEAGLEDREQFTVNVRHL